MVYHFVNLVSWRYFVDSNTDLSRSVVYCDSVILKLLVRYIFGVSVQQISGPAHYEMNFEGLKSKCILSPFKGSDDNVYELPRWQTMNHVVCTDDIREIVSKYRNICIGISAPKQDKLALEIIREFPDKEIYCYGAAMSTRTIGMNKLQKLGLLWLYFLLKSPRRTISKLMTTMKEIRRIIFLSKCKAEFKEFIDLIR